MDFAAAAHIAIGNLTSPAVLAFILGVIVTATLRADLRLPQPVYQAISVYLLLAIGLKGGVALREADLGALVAPLIAALALGSLIPVAAFAVLGRVTRLSGTDRGALSAHYGSTSLVTFTAAIALLEVMKLPAEGYVVTLLTVMEIPGIVVGLMLASRARVLDRVPVLVGGGDAGSDSSEPAHGAAHGAAHRAAWRTGLGEVMASPSVLLLVGGLVIGWVTGPLGYEKVEPLFTGVFPGMLAIFLLHLGCVAGGHLRQVRSAGPGLIGFALAFPIVAGGLGVAVGTMIGMSTGGAALLGVLCGSASYIAAPAAVGIALPRADQGLCLTASLGMTFPFNMLIGLPVLVTLASVLGRMPG